MPDATQKKTYKPTLNLPQTGFPMKANLVQNEPATLRRWADGDLYARIRERRAGAQRFVFHDGPPYANGSIHLGHLLNKVLKDFVVRGRTMAGYDVPYVPGWDCHGLPIEHRVLEESQGADEAGSAPSPSHAATPSSAHSPLAIRRRCAKYAAKHVELQARQMQRLLTLADYSDPYLTMNPGYEAAVLEVFATMVERGLVYRGLKPVHWSIENQTALADAELEYHDREDTSVYVLLNVHESSWDMANLPMPAGTVVDDAAIYLMVWTTTPWTLPANLAVAVSPRAEYGLYTVDIDGRQVSVLVAYELADRVLELSLEDADVPDEPLALFTGEQLVGLTYRHPFMPIDAAAPDRRVVAADYVTLQDGTGMVHTAPGHGTEDYQTGIAESLGIYCPVRADGTFDDSVPEWLRGRSVWEANDLVIERLRTDGHLFHAAKYEHSYPHDWRSKTPTIFRATEQWFVSVDGEYHSEPPHSEPGSDAAGTTSGGTQTGAGTARLAKDTLRERALAVTANDVAFHPEWGRNRMRGMLESRPDWCISRQRAWGLPIPAFYPPDGETGDPLLTPDSIRAVASTIETQGSDAWFELDPDELLGEYEPETDPAVTDNERLAWILPKNRRPQHPINRGEDIFDVWFESGSSWHAVLDRRGIGHDVHQQPVADLYLEGSDQHRGWFQLSLLPSLACTGRPPFAAVLTHGFMVDRHGEKISKSNVEQRERIPSLEEVFEDYGADVCRWWVSSLSIANDIKVDKEYIKEAGEEYRKVRNTLRFLLGNLYDYETGGGVPDASPAPPPESLSVGVEDTQPDLNRWVLGELSRVVAGVRNAFDTYDFRRVHDLLFDFCNDTLSAVYLAAVKDRLYCDAADSPRRRATQAAMHRIAHDLCLLLAPILPHTADEAWSALHGEGAAESVHLQAWPEPSPREVAGDARWNAILTARDAVLKRIEAYRQEQCVKNPLDLGVVVSPQDSGAPLLELDPVDAADLLGVSRFEQGAAETDPIIDLRDQPRCERSWKRDATVRERSDGGMLTDRDARAVGVE